MMRLPDLPDLTPRRRLLLLALLVSVVAGVILGLRDGPDLTLSYGDTDDAMRLVLARQLVHGRGWWDQLQTGLQPPEGVYLHWSRLLDGGIAAMERVFALFLNWNDAETATRFLWPMLWIVPTVVATLLAARRIAEPIPAPHWALGIAGLLMVLHLPLYNQFHPGRIDHHDAQMAFYMLAFAGAVQGRDKTWAPWLTGIASGLGIAIGLEALVFQALIGAALALRYVFETEEETALKHYGLGLTGSTVLAFLIQTPPWRWSVNACDALAFNLVAAIVVAGAGLVIAGRLTRGATPLVRFAALGVAGALAGATYLGLDRNCLHGPFADVDPRLKPFWLDWVREVAPWPRLFKRHPDDAIAVAAPEVLGLIAWLWLGRTREARTLAAGRLSGALLIATSAAGFTMVRAAGYAAWTAVPLIACAAAEVAWRYRRLGLLAPVVAAIIAAPLGVTGVALAAGKLWSQATARKGAAAAPKKAEPADYCFNSSSYRVLAAQPPGRVLGDIDFGPFVLALTPHTTLSAPYHRMNRGIMAARGVLTADADAAGPNGAEARARALGISYVLNCAAHHANADRAGIPANSLQAEMDRSDWPDWLQLVSNEMDPILVFRVVPATSR